MFIPVDKEHFSPLIFKWKKQTVMINILYGTANNTARIFIQTLVKMYVKLYFKNMVDGEAEFQKYSTLPMTNGQ